MDMTRYKELISIFMDGEPSAAEMAELEQLLCSDDHLALEISQQLALWETWSLETNPARSEKTFIDGFYSRLQDASESEEPAPSSIIQLHNKKRRFPIFHLGWAVAAGIALLLGLVCFVPREQPAQVSEKTPSDSRNCSVCIRGETVCTHCILGTTEQCGLAVRYVDTAGKTCVIQVTGIIERLTPAPGINESCGRPVPVMVEGELVLENNQLMIASAKFSIPKNDDS